MGLKGLTIETAPQAEAHIHAADDRAIWEAVIGMDGVADVGQKLKATLLSNNLLRIYDGALIVGGAIARIPFGEYEDVTINNGTQNQKRNDLVVAEIEANGATESMKITYIQGTPGTAAVDPDYTAGNVYEGETKRQYPLYRVKLDGLNVEAVETMFEVVPKLEQVKAEVSELNSKLTGLLVVEETTETGTGLSYIVKPDKLGYILVSAYCYADEFQSVEVRAIRRNSKTKTYAILFNANAASGTYFAMRYIWIKL